jgi:chaperonin GroES
MIKMLHDRVLIKPLEPEEITRGGIIIPDTAKDKPQKGIVVSVGPKSTLEPGDEVTFGQFVGMDLVIDGEKLLVMRDYDIFCYDRKS